MELDRGNHVGILVLFGIHMIRLRISGLKKVHLAIWEAMGGSWKSEIKKNRQAKLTEINLDDMFLTNLVSNEVCYCLI